jgi:hypothetical protein
VMDQWAHNLYRSKRSWNPMIINISGMWFPHICPNRRFFRYVPALLYSWLEEYSWTALHLGAWMCCLH